MDYQPIMNEVKIIDNAVTPMFLEYVRFQMQESENWSWQYPKGAHFSKRHPKLTLIDGTEQPPKVERLAGIAMSLFLMVYEKGLHGLVYPELMWAGASIKDKHREDNTHTDHMDDVPKNMKVLKVLGVLNSDWKQEWGGGFTWNGKTYYAKPGSFYVFDPRVPHRADNILCDEKRVAIDYTVKAITYHKQDKTTEVQM